MTVNFSDLEYDSDYGVLALEGGQRVYYKRRNWRLHAVSSSGEMDIWHFLVWEYTENSSAIGVLEFSPLSSNFQ